MEPGDLTADSGDLTVDSDYLTLIEMKKPKQNEDNELDKSLTELFGLKSRKEKNSSDPVSRIVLIHIVNK